MDTYLNTYQILRDVREMLGEYDEDLMQGRDASGAYSNVFLTRRINEAQALLYAFLMKVIPDEFYAETTITASASELALPWNFGRIIQLRDSNGTVVTPVKPRQRPAQAAAGSDLQYYRKGRSLYLTRSGISSTYTLYYRLAPREIHAGRASAGAATSITLDADYAPTVADYYNGMTLENLTQDWTDEIDDYTAARVATISETAAANDIYGIVPEIPDPFHYLIAPRAALEAKMKHSNPKERPGASDFTSWQQKVVETLSSFNIAEDTMYPEHLWSDVCGGFSGGVWVSMPGHDSPIWDGF